MYTTGSVADSIKDNAPETGNTYTTSLTDMVKNISDKAADLNQNYQNQAYVPQGGGFGGVGGGTSAPQQDIQALLANLSAYKPPN